MSRLRLVPIVLAVVLLATVAAAIVAGAGPGGAATSAATIPVDNGTSVELRPADGPNGDRYASLDGDGELQLDFDSLNREGRTIADRVFVVEANDGNRSLEVSVTSEAGDVSFYWDSDPRNPASEPRVLEPNEAVRVGVEVEAGQTVDDGTFLVHARTATTDPERERPEEIGGPLVPDRSGLRWNVSEPGRSVDLTVPVRNPTSATVTQSVGLQIDGTTVEFRNVTVPAHGSANVTFAYAFGSSGTYQVGVNGRTVGTVTVGGARIEVVDASLAQPVILHGEAATVTARVANRGSVEGTYTATLEVGGAVVDQQTVSVPAGETVEVEFERTFDDRGGYDVAVGGESAGTLYVESPGGAAARRFGSEYGGLLGVLSVPTAGAAVALARGRVGL